MCVCVYLFSSSVSYFEQTTTKNSSEYNSQTRQISFSRPYFSFLAKKQRCYFLFFSSQLFSFQFTYIFLYYS